MTKTFKPGDMVEPKRLKVVSDLKIETDNLRHFVDCTVDGGFRYPIPVDFLELVPIHQPSAELKAVVREAIWDAYLTSSPKDWDGMAQAAIAALSQAKPAKGEDEVWNEAIEAAAHECYEKLDFDNILKLKRPIAALRKGESNG